MKGLRIEVRVGESIVVDGGRLTLTLEEKSGQRARIRFDAPEDLDIKRVNPTVNVRSRGLGKQ